MAWVAVAVAGTALVGGIYSSKKASRDAKNAAATGAAGQQAGLDYQIEREAIPRQFSEGALTKLGGLYGLEGGEGNQQELIDRAMESPLYTQLMGNQKFGEDAILRNQSATGGFRSGNTQVNLSEYNTRLKNEALLSSYNDQLGGLQSMANLPNNANNIASSMAGIGQTNAMGQIASAQARQQGYQNIGNTLMSGLQYYSQQKLGQQNQNIDYSDIRLKTDIEFLHSTNGHNIYKWTWKPLAKILGLEGKSQGVMAHEVYAYMPDAVSTKHGLIMVDYGQLGLERAA